MLSEKRKEHNKNVLGTLLKDARVKEGYTQKALADALGIEYYTMISQMELGYISIPAAFWANIARTLNINQSEWVLRCLDQIMPEVYSALFGSKSISEVSEFLTNLNHGVYEQKENGDV